MYRLVLILTLAWSTPSMAFGPWGVERLATNAIEQADSGARAELIAHATETSEEPRGQAPLRGMADLLGLLDPYFETGAAPAEQRRAAHLLAEALARTIGRPGYFTHQSAWRSHIVFQNHHLFDLDRIPLPVVARFPRKHESNIEHWDTTALRVASPGFGTSRTRMAKGLPGVGFAGFPVQLCRLSPASGAPYFELDWQTMQRVFARIPTGLTYEQACRGFPGEKAYWQARLDVLTTQYGVARTPRRTLTLPETVPQQP